MKPIEARLLLQRPGFSLDVDLRLPGRGVSVLFGPSGSGKTTLLRCLAGLEPLAQGRVVVDDEVWLDGTRSRPTHQRAIGYVFQEASLFEHLSVRDNLRYGLRRLRAPQPPDWTSTLERLGIAGLLDRRPASLSGGERQRVAIARALLLQPRVLLMDEPLSALDHARKREILADLERLRDDLHVPLIYVSHAADEVARLADHLVVLAQGRVQAQGPLAEVLTRIDSPIRLGEDDGVVLCGVLAERAPEWGLVRVDCAGASLWTRDDGLALGQSVRLRVLARDVSLATDPGQSSIQNVWRAQIEAVADDAHPALALVLLRVGQSRLLARLTRRALHQLGLQPGQTVWAQVKSAALLA